MNFMISFKLRHVLCACIFLTSAIWTTEAQVVVYPHILESRSENGEKVLKVNDELIFKLKTGTIFAEKLAFKDDEEHLGEYYLNGSEYNKYIYLDEENGTIVSLFETDGLCVTGILGGNLRIQPREYNNRPTNGQVAHVIERLDAPLTSTSGDNGPASKEPNEANIELSIFLDSKFKEIFEYDRKKPQQLITYVGIFVHAMQLKLAPFSLSLTILAIVFRRVTWTVVQPANNPNQIIGSETFWSFQKVMWTNEDCSIADVCLLLTGYDMVSIQDGIVDRTISGLARIGGACESDEKYAMSEDTPRVFTGILSAVHELLHTVGVVHDGEDVTPRLGIRYPGHPGALSCNSDMFLMSPNVPEKSWGVTHMNLSSCSMDQLKVLLESPKKSCLKTRSGSKQIQMPSRLPGEYMSIEKYCNTFIQGSTANVKTECVLECKLEINDTISLTQVPVPDGAVCSEEEGKICINGKCVVRPKKKPKGNAKKPEAARRTP